jgi:broad specificity phosphatase PhoE
VVTRRVWLVRHGEPAVDGTLDPGLTPLGHEQAAELPGRIRAALLPEVPGATGEAGPVALRTSPLRRARETAAPLEVAWGAAAVVDPAFRELPSTHTDVAGRQAWLRVAMRSTFAELDELQRTWRDAIIAAVRSLPGDTVVTTHAVVINAVTGWCTADDAVLGWVPAHCSITEVAVASDGALRLVARGEGRAAGPVV